jgi:hypothetical protein
MDVTAVTVLPASVTAAWPCRTCQARSWHPDALLRTHASRSFDLGLECGKTTTLQAFLQNPNPDAYIFDALPSPSDPLLADYAPPPGAPQEEAQDYLHHLVSLPALRPRFRWFLVGVAGSGFTAHQDPHGTCAWNALVHGRKRWAVLPPSTPPEAVFPGWSAAAPGPPSAQASARGWFAHALPLLERAAVPGLRVFTQEEGETVLLPAGWWHCCESLSPVTVGVTHNWLSREGFLREVAKLGPGSALAAQWRERAARAGLAVA